MQTKHAVLGLVTIAVGCAAASEDDGDAQNGALSAGTENQFGEIIRPNEEADFARFAEEIQTIQAKNAAKNGNGIERGFHPKTVGCFLGKFTVRSDAPAAVRVGLFAEPKTYDTVVRFSNSNGIDSPDTRPDKRGLALKLIDVDGAKLLDAASTQDFVFANHPTTVTDDGAQFMNLAVTLSDSDGALDAFARVSSWALKNPKQGLNLLHSLTVPKSDATERFWSQTAYTLGDQVMKYAVTPCAGAAAGTFDAEGNPHDLVIDDNYLRDDLRGRLRSRDLCWDFTLQLRTDPANMPVELPSIEWDEKVSRPIPVARLVIPQQDPTSDHGAAVTKTCDGLSFNPWHGRVEHRPLGHMSRTRKGVYQSSSANRKGGAEPTRADLAELLSPPEP